MDSVRSDVVVIVSLGINIVMVAIAYWTLRINIKKFKQDQELIKRDVVQVSTSVSEAKNKFLAIGENLKTLDKTVQNIIMGNPKVTIDSPINGSRVHHVVPLHGTVEDLPNGTELWVIKEVNIGNYHPDNGPAFISGNKWESTAFVGNSTQGADAGIAFKIHIVEASHETGNKFRNYLGSAHRTGNWSGIGTIYDGKIVATIKVTRDDSC